MFSHAATDNLALLAEWQEWLRRNRYAPTTIDGYARASRRFLREFPDTDPSLWTAEHVERHLDGLRLSAASYVTTLADLRPFFKWLRRSKRLLRGDPCASIDPPTPAKKMRHALLPDQFKALCRAAPHLKSLVAFHLLYHSGLRIGELVWVRVGDVLLDRRLVHVLHGKGSRRSGPRERWTVLHPESAKVVRLWLWRSVRLHPDLYLLGVRRGLRPISRTAVRLWLAAARGKAGLPAEVTPHALRHGFNKWCKIHGIPIEVTAAFMGHDDLKTTWQVYGSMTPDELREVYDRALAKTT